jgi:phage-related protein
MAIPAINRCRDWLSEGIGWTVPVLADAIKAMCARWKVGPHGVADDAIFAKTGSGTGCIADEFARAGVHFEPAQKRIRRELGLRWDWDAWRSMRSDDLRTMTLEAFCARHGCSIGAASQRRSSLKLGQGMVHDGDGS